jgi:hypothetical protein
VRFGTAYRGGTFQGRNYVAPPSRGGYYARGSYHGGGGYNGGGRHH